MIRQIEKPIDITYLPIISVRCDLDALAKHHGFKLFEDQDDLGKMRCAYLESDAGTRFLVLAYAYRTTPRGIVDIAIPVGLDNLQAAMRDIVEELGISDDDFTVREVRYDDVA